MRPFFCIFFMFSVSMGVMAQDPTACPTWKKPNPYADRGDYMEQMRKSYGKRVKEIKPESQTETPPVAQQESKPIIKKQRNTTSTGLKLSDVFDIPEKKVEPVAVVEGKQEVIKPEPAAETNPEFESEEDEEDEMLASSDVVDEQTEEQAPKKVKAKKAKKASVRKSPNNGVKKVRGLRKDKAVRCSTKF